MRNHFSSYEMKERLINLLNMIRKQLKSEPKMSRFKFVVNGFICEDTGQDVKLWFLLRIRSTVGRSKGGKWAVHKVDKRLVRFDPFVCTMSVTRSVRLGPPY